MCMYQQLDNLFQKNTVNYYTFGKFLLFLMYKIWPFVLLLLLFIIIIIIIYLFIYLSQSSLHNNTLPNPLSFPVTWWFNFSKLINLSVEVFLHISSPLESSRLLSHIFLHRSQVSIHRCADHNYNIWMVHMKQWCHFN